MSVELTAFDFIAPAGVGGTATVWQARHRATKRLVAVKLLLADESLTPRKLRRFRAEVRAVAQLNHPGIVRLYDHGLVEEDITVDRLGHVSSGAPFIVMEWVDGGDLYQHLGQMDWADTRALLLALLEALAAAHAQGTVHRDIKPQNILLSGRGPLITDFGIAYAGERDSHEGEEDLVVGTPSYLAPEQVRSKWRQYGPWTDLYALGCVAYSMVCGRPPFKGEFPLDTMRLHLTEPIPTLAPLFPVPAGLEDWITRLLQKIPSARYQFAADATRALIALDGPEALREEGAQPSPGDFGMETLILGSPESGTLLSTPVFLADESVDWNTSSPYDEVAPAPGSWRPPRAPLARAQLAGLGLSVFAIANAPFCGREDERDILWEQLRRTSTERDLTVSLVRGAAGRGKTSLATWIARRAHELGVAHVLTMQHVQGFAQIDGLSNMLETHFRSYGLEGKALLDCIQRRLGPMAPPPLSRAIAALMSPDLSFRDANGGVTLFQPAERARAVCDLFEFLARDRAVVLVIDDLQWGANALMLLNSLLVSPNPVPLAILATVRDYAPSSIPRWPDRLQALLDSPRVSAVTLGPLDAQACIALIRSRIALSDRLAKQLIARTEGNPLFSEELVRQWLMDGDLVLGNDGYQLRPGRSRQLPEGLHELWQRRLAGAMQNASASEWAALEQAAVLGRRFEEDVWRDALAAGKLTVSSDLLERLADQGLLISDDDDWAFSHALLCESVQLRARQQNRWEDANSHAADALVKRSEVDQERVAHHLLEAKRDQDALVPLRTACQHRRLFSDYRRAQELAVVLAGTFRRLKTPRSSVEFNENRILWAVLERVQGRGANGRRHAAHILKSAKGENAGPIRAQALKELSHGTGDEMEALQLLEQAVNELEATPFTEHHASIYLEMCNIFTHLNRLKDARHFAELANTVLERLDPSRISRFRAQRLQASLSIQMGLIYHQDGRLSEAREHYERAFSTAHALGARFTMGYASDFLGKVATDARDWSRAEQHFLDAEEIWTRIGNFIAPAAALNRALMEARRGSGGVAGLIADAASAAFRGSGNARIAVQCQLQGSFCYAHALDWPTVDLRLAPIFTPDGYQLIDRETLVLFQEIVILAHENGQSQRAATLLEVMGRRAADLEQHDIIQWVDAFVGQPKPSTPE